MLENIKYDIIGVSETRIAGEKMMKLSNGSYYFHYGESKGLRGTGFYIHESITDKVYVVKGISERISLVKLTIGKSTRLTIIQIYAPTMKAEVEEKEEFYELLQDTFEKEREYYNIIMGDFNAKIQAGSKHSFSIGKYSTGEETNSNGELLINIAERNNLKIANTYYQKRKSNKWTWASPDGATKNEIDFFLIDDMRVMQDVGIVKKLKFPSDHRAIQIKLRIPRRSPIKNAVKATKTYIRNASDIENLDEIKKNLNSKIEGLKEREPVQNRYDKLEKIITEINNEAKVKKESNRTEDKLSEKTKEVIRKRNEMISKSNKTIIERIETAEIRKTVAKLIKHDIKEYNEKITKEILEKSWSIKKVKKSLCPGQYLMNSLTNEEGKREYRREELVQVATKFYRKLYESEPREEDEDKETGVDIDDRSNETSSPPILKAEVESVVKNLRDDKATGPDRIKNEILKIFANELSPALTDLFNLIMEEEKIPCQWRIVDLILLHKKGDKSDTRNYRPLSLSSSVSKIFSKVIKNRCYQQLDENQGKEQAGFRKGCSTIDHLFIMNQLIEKANEYKITINILLIDFYKAFDTVNHKFLWKTLERQGLPQKYIRIIKGTYMDSKARVKTDKMGPEFLIRRGVKQGDPLAPNLYNAVLEEIFWELGWEEKGIKINGEWLSNIRFADDTVLISQNKRELQKMVNEFQEKSKQSGQVINTDKTKLISNEDNDEKIVVEGKEIEIVKEAIYLGQTVAIDDRLDKEISRRINQGWKNYWSLRQIYKSNMSIKNKIRVWESCTLPALVYGSQTWAPTNSQLDKMRKTQLAMERSMLKIKRSERMKNRTVREQTVSKDIRYVIKKQKIRYAGHVSRKTNNRWEKILLDWTPYDYKRARGRPRRRWIDEIKSYAGIAWQRDARDRIRWERIGEAYARRWENYKI